MIENSECENLTGVYYTGSWILMTIFLICIKKLNEKLNALATIALSIRLSKRLIQIKAFFSSQFTY